MTDSRYSHDYIQPIISNILALAEKICDFEDLIIFLQNNGGKQIADTISRLTSFFAQVSVVESIYFMHSKKFTRSLARPSDLALQNLFSNIQSCISSFIKNLKKNSQTITTVGKFTYTLKLFPNYMIPHSIWICEKVLQNRSTYFDVPNPINHYSSIIVKLMYGDQSVLNQSSEQTLMEAFGNNFTKKAAAIADRLEEKSLIDSLEDLHSQIVGISKIMNIEVEECTNKPKRPKHNHDNTNGKFNVCT
jgi:hypothetical protein